MLESTLQLIKEKSEELQVQKKYRDSQQSIDDSNNADAIVGMAVESLVNKYVEKTANNLDMMLNAREDESIVVNLRCEIKDGRVTLKAKGVDASSVSTTIEDLKKSAEEEGVYFAVTADISITFSLPIHQLNGVFFDKNVGEIIDGYFGQSAPTFKKLYKQLAVEMLED